MERIAKFIARCGVASRRKAELLVREGRVTVDGAVITDVATKIDPDAAMVTVDTQHIAVPNKIYLLFNKPKGVITTKCDTHDRQTVLDYLPHTFHAVHPVGRLDKDTTGLLILTNDGELTHLLTYPRHGIKKKYIVEIKGKVSREAIAQLESGVQLEDGYTSPAQISDVTYRPTTTIVSITIAEGKKRQVRRMFETVGYDVVALIRIAVGPLVLGNVPIGKYRLLSQREIRLLQESAQ